MFADWSKYLRFIAIILVGKDDEPTNSIDDDRDRSYIDLQHCMPKARRVSIITTSWSSTAQEMTIGEVVDIELSEEAELF